MSRKSVASTAMESCHHAAWNATVGASRPSQGQELSWVGGTGRTPSRVAITTGKPRGEHQTFPLDPQYLARAPHMPLASTCRDKQWPETRARVVCVHGDICFADARGTQVRPGGGSRAAAPILETAWWVDFSAYGQGLERRGACTLRVRGSVCPGRCRVRDSPDLACTVVTDEQRPVLQHRDADRPAPDLWRVFAKHPADHEILVPADRLAFPERNEDDLVPRALRAVGRSAQRDEGASAYRSGNWRPA